MNKFSKIVSSLVLATTVLSPVAHAQVSANVCSPEGTTFAFFNGVQTTRMEGTFALLYFRLYYGRLDGQGEVLRYELFYNWTTGLEDFVETFAQRLAEQQEISNRFELFDEFRRGGGSWLTALGSVLTRVPTLVENFNNYLNAQAAATLTALIRTPPNTESNYVAHRARLDTLALQGNKILMLAHSQGNLFANSAYDYIKPKVGEGAVGIVHVAPASPILNGPYSLADKDLVINGLRSTGTVPAITKTIPAFSDRPAGDNGFTDFLGHGLIEIYMNPAFATRGEIDASVNAKLSSLRAPPGAASLGFFTVTLTWNGSGDVDLHAFEPGGAHVFYSAKTGPSGFLDVDNTNANGPEHYYATCDVNRLQTGTYRIGINNYAAATGRTATVQIASYSDGPLLTRDLDVGPVRGSSGNASPISVANVVVTKDAVTGRYRVSLGQ